MIKRALTFLGVFGMLLLAQPRAFAAPSDGLEGTYFFSTSGLSSLTDSDCDVNGIVKAALTNGSLRFDGAGHIVSSGSYVGIDIGPSNCPVSNYYLSGTYTSQTNSDGSIQATGMLTTNFQGRGAGCAGTKLVNQPFSLYTTRGGSLSIVTYGAGDGSSYAQGGAAPVCSANVDFFVTSGTGMKRGL